MQNLEGLYEDIKKYNELFKAKTYSDAVEEFYKKNYSIFNELNVMAQKVSEGIENIYAPKEEEKEKSIIHKAVFSDRKKDDLIPSDREKLSDEMTERLDEIAVEYVNAAAEVLYVNGKRPKGRNIEQYDCKAGRFDCTGIECRKGNRESKGKFVSD